MSRPAFRLDFLATTTGPDGPDQDRAPDTEPLGDVTITCTPSITHIIYPPSAPGEPYETSFIKAFKATTGADGRLKDPDGMSGIELPAANPTAAPSGFSWKIETRWGGTATITKSFPAPPGGTVVDFSTVITQPANPSAALAAWTAAVTTTTAARDETLVARDETLDARDDTLSAATTATSAAATATNAAATAAIGGFLSGTGSPQGVLTAPVGSQYRDTAVTTGALIWVKESGTGATGWRVQHGDTGWRDITPEGMWVLASVAGYCRIKRSGDLVTLVGRITPATDQVGLARSTARNVVITPAGFAPANPYAPYGTAILGSISQVGGVIGNYGSTTNIGLYTLWTGTYAAGDVVSFEATWRTTAAWPTILPGSPA